MWRKEAENLKRWRVRNDVANAGSQWPPGQMAENVLQVGCVKADREISPASVSDLGMRGDLEAPEWSM